MARQRTPIGNEDFKIVKCSNCGFPCKLGRDKIKEGNGKEFYEITHTQDQAPDDYKITYGCPQCGKGDYTKD